MSAPLQHVQPQIETYGSIDLAAINLYNLEQVQQLRKDSKKLSDNSKVESPDPDSPEVPDDTANRFLEQLQHQDNKGLVQPTLHTSEIKEFLLIMGSQADIQHNDLLLTSPTKHNGISTQYREDYIAAAEARALTADATLEPDHSTSDGFWSLYRDLAAPSIQTLSWVDACEALGFMQEPEYTQVLAIAWMKKMEASPLGGGILALDTGLGKTLTTLFHVVLQAEQIKAKAKEGVIINAQPTLVKQLKVWFYYSSSTEETLSPEQQLLCLPTDPQEANDKLKQFYPPTNPTSTRVVVLTSYETHTQRNIQIITRHDNAAFLEQEGFGDSKFAKDQKLIPDALSTMKKAQANLFVLNPVVFTCMANKGDLQATVGIDVLQAVLGILQFKVTMASTFEINGQSIRTGTNLMPYQSNITDADLRKIRDKETNWDPDGSIDERVRIRINSMNDDYVSQQANSLIRRLLGFHHVFIGYNNKEQKLILDNSVRPMPCNIKPFIVIVDTNWDVNADPKENVGKGDLEVNHGVANADGDATSNGMKDV
ncbi:hypothetical protein DV738_g5267, partial [Chaetothyriales sp. CBS 135597]